MTSPAPLDGELAWAISTWNGYEAPETPLGRDRVESLTRHLTAAGFGKLRKDDGGLGAIFELAAKARQTVLDLMDDPKDKSGQAS